jgi:hypothetical protein
MRAAVRNQNGRYVGFKLNSFIQNISGVSFLMDTAKPHSQSSFMFDLLNLLGISLLAGLSSAIALAGIVLLLSSGS